MRKVHRLEQGSPEWHAHRNTPGMVNGSELAAIMGLSSYKSRAEVLREKATGITEEITPAKKRRFDLGHLFESLARPRAEEIIEDDLYPMVMSDEIDGVLLSVSLDGITQGYDLTFEHKSLNMALADALDTGTIPAEYHPQMEAGLMVTGAARCLFVASRWNEDTHECEGLKYAWYESQPELRPQIIAACKQFAYDRENYQHVEHVERPKAEVQIELPALFVQAKGQITDSNMVAYGEALKNKLAEVRAIQLVTDQDFSNAKAAAAMFRDQYKKLELAKQAMLAQTVTIGEAARMIDAWREDLRQTALQLEKDVEKEDLAKKAAIVDGGRTKYKAHIAALNERLGGNYSQHMPAEDFVAAIKSKRSYSSMHDAVDGALAKLKIEANEIADRIEANRKTLQYDAHTDAMHLFPDFAAVCTKSREDFDALFFQRAQQDEQRKEAERERIRQEEEFKATQAAELEQRRKDEQTAAAEAALNSANDQRGKAAEATHAEPTATATPQAPAASTPTHPVAAINDMAQDDAATITEFIALLPIGLVEKKALRATLEKFVKYQRARSLKMGVAA